MQLFYLIDVSSSMEGKKLDCVKTNLSDSIAKMTLGSLALYTFTDKLTEVVPLTTDRKLVQSKIRLLEASGSTRIQSCLSSLYTRIGAAKGTKTQIQIYTDAEDSVDEEELKKAYEDFRSEKKGTVRPLLFLEEETECAAILRRVFPTFVSSDEKSLDAAMQKSEALLRNFAQMTSQLAGMEAKLTTIESAGKLEDIRADLKDVFNSLHPAEEELKATEEEFQVIEKEEKALTASRHAIARYMQAPGPHLDLKRAIKMAQDEGRKVRTEYRRVRKMYMEKAGALMKNINARTAEVKAKEEAQEKLEEELSKALKEFQETFEAYRDEADEDFTVTLKECAQKIKGRAEVMDVSMNELMEARTRLLRMAEAVEHGKSKQEILGQNIEENLTWLNRSLIESLRRAKKATKLENC